MSKVIIGALAVMAVLSLLGVAIALTTLPQGRAIEGVHVIGADISGLNREQAKRYLSEYLKRLLEEPIVIGDSVSVATVIPKELGITIDTERTLDTALAFGNTGSYLRRLFERWQAKRSPVSIKANIDYKEEILLSALKELGDRWNKKPRAAKFVVQHGEVTILPETYGQAIDTNALAAEVIDKVPRTRHRTVLVKPEPIVPDRTAEQLNQLGISNLVARFETSFDPSNQNRVKNIQIAAEALNGRLVAPNQTLSFNAIVGPRLEEYGYREAPVIVDGQLVPDIGGGVCQVSSTFFNAILLAGFEIVRRAPHSIPSTYVDLGRDAAVADGLIDLVVTNPSKNHYLITTNVSSNSVVFSIYGPQRDTSYSLYTTIDDVLPHQTEYRYASSLDPGTEEIIPGQKGYRVSLWRETRTRGEGIKTELISRSMYPPRNTLIYRRGE